MMNISFTKLAEVLAQEVVNDLNEMEGTRVGWHLLTTEERDAQGNLWKNRFHTMIRDATSVRNYEAFFDGSATPNPGQMKIGGYFNDTGGYEKYNYSRDLGHGSNNEAEYLSLIYLAERLIEHEVTSVTIKGDSLLVVNQVRGIWKANEKMRPYRDKARELLDQLAWYKILHVPRAQNKKADALT
jgi:ribonuclease HI